MIEISRLENSLPTSGESHMNREFEWRIQVAIAEQLERIANSLEVKDKKPEPQKWATKPIPRQSCPECMGGGTVTHDEDCPRFGQL